jgi:hypothetical protein
MVTTLLTTQLSPNPSRLQRSFRHAPHKLFSFLLHAWCIPLGCKNLQWHHAPHNHLPELDTSRTPSRCNVSLRRHAPCKYLPEQLCWCIPPLCNVSQWCHATHKLNHLLKTSQTAPRCNVSSPASRHAPRKHLPEQLCWCAHLATMFVSQWRHAPHKLHFDCAAHHCPFLPIPLQE